MFTKIVTLLTGFMPYLKTLAASTATKVDDAVVAALDLLIGDSDFINLISGWLNPPKGASDGHSATPFPHSYEAAIALPDGHLLLAILARLGISADTMKLLWPFILAIVKTLIL